MLSDSGTVGSKMARLLGLPAPSAKRAASCCPGGFAPGDDADMDDGGTDDDDADAAMVTDEAEDANCPSFGRSTLTQPPGGELGAWRPRRRLRGVFINVPVSTSM